MFTACDVGGEFRDRDMNRLWEVILSRFYLVLVFTEVRDAWQKIFYLNIWSKWYRNTKLHLVLDLSRFLEFFILSLPLFRVIKEHQNFWVILDLSFRRAFGGPHDNINFGINADNRIKESFSKATDRSTLWTQRRCLYRLFQSKTRFRMSFKRWKMGWFRMTSFGCLATRIPNHRSMPRLKQSSTIWTEVLSI